LKIIGKNGILYNLIQGSSKVVLKAINNIKNLFTIFKVQNFAKFFKIMNIFKLFLI